MQRFKSKFGIDPNFPIELLRDIYRIRKVDGFVPQMILNLGLNPTSYELRLFFETFDGLMDEPLDLTVFLDAPIPTTTAAAAQNQKIQSTKPVTEDLIDFTSESLVAPNSNFPTEMPNDKFDFDRSMPPEESRLPLLANVDEKTLSSTGAMDFESCTGGSDDEMMDIQDEGNNPSIILSQDLSAESVSPVLQFGDIPMEISNGRIASQFHSPTADLPFADVGKIIKENELLKLQIKEENSKHSLMEAESNSKSQKIDEAMLEMKNLQDQISNMEDQFMRKMSELETVIEDKEECKREIISEHKIHIAQLKDDLLVKERVLLELNHTIDGLEKSISQSSQIINANELELIDLRSKLSERYEASSELESKNGLICVLKMKTAALETTNLEQQTTLSAITQENVSLSEELMNSNCLIAQFTCAAQESGAKICDLEIKLAELKNVESILTAAVKDASIEINELKDSLGLKTEEIASKCSEIADYAVKCEELVLLHSNATNELKLKNEELTSLKAEFEINQAQNSVFVRSQKELDLAAALQKESYDRLFASIQRERADIVFSLESLFSNITNIQEAEKIKIKTNFDHFEAKLERLHTMQQSSANAMATKNYLLEDLTTQISRSRQNSASSAEELISAHKQIELLSMQLQSKEKIILELKTTIDFNDQEQAAIYEESSKVFNELDSLKLKLKDADAELEVLRKQVAESALFKEQYESTVLKLEELQHKFLEYESSMLQYQSQDQELQKSLRESEKLNLAIQAKLDLLSTQQDAEKQALDIQIKNYMELLAKAQAELIAVNTQREKENLSVQKLEYELLDKTETAYELRGKLDESKAERDQMELKVKAMIDEADKSKRISSENLAQVTKIKDLEEKLSQSTARYNNLETQIDSSSKQIAKITEEKSALEKIHNDTSAQCVSLGQEVITLRGEIKILRETIQRKKKTQKIASLNAIPEDAIVEEPPVADNSLTTVEPKKRTRKRRESVRLDNELDVENKNPQLDDVTPIKKKSKSIDAPGM